LPAPRKKTKIQLGEKQMANKLKFKNQVDSWAKIDESVITTPDIFHERSF